MQLNLCYKEISLKPAEVHIGCFMWMQECRNQVPWFTSQTETNKTVLPLCWQPTVPTPAWSKGWRSSLTPAFIQKHWHCFCHMFLIVLSLHAPCWRRLCRLLGVEPPQGLPQLSCCVAAFETALEAVGRSLPPAGMLLLLFPSWRTFAKAILRF